MGFISIVRERAPVHSLCVVLFFLPGIAPALAEQLFELNEIVVTGTRTNKTLLETPVRTELINRAEIEKTHARDLKQALEDVPGLLLKGNPKSGFEAWLQGLDSDRVLIVIDGEPITPSTGSSVDLSQLATADIRRIEIVKGATSALYGSSAMGGVINVITRKPELPLDYSLTVDGGSYGKSHTGTKNEVAARSLSGNLMLKRERWSLGITASQRHSEGFDLDNSTYVSEGAEGDKSNLDLRLAYTPNEQTGYFFAPRYYRENISNRMSSFAPGVGEIKKIKREDAERFHNTVGAEKNWADGQRLRAWLVADNWYDVTQQDVLATSHVDQQRTAEIDLYRTELQWDKPWGDTHLFTAGLLAGHSVLQQDKVEQGAWVKEVDSADKSNIEAYLQDDIFLNEHWELVPGLRIQRDSDFGYEAAPKINALLSPDWFSDVTTNIRLGYGKGYRIPNLKERFFVFDHSALGYKVLGNRDLHAESSDSYQLGIEFAHAERFHFDISLFHNRIKNLIDTDFSHMEEGIQIFTYQNISHALTQGLETSLKYQFHPRLKIKTSATWLDSEDRDSGKTLTNRPALQIKLGIDYELKTRGSTISLRGVFQSEEFIDSGNTLESPGWTSWDLKFNHPLSENISIFAGLDNLTNEHRNPAKPGLDFRPLEPRFTYLGLRLNK